MNAVRAPGIVVRQEAGAFVVAIYPATTSGRKAAEAFAALYGGAATEERCFQCCCGELFLEREPCEAHCRCTKCGAGPVARTMSVAGPGANRLCNGCIFQAAVAEAVAKLPPQ